MGVHHDSWTLVTPHGAVWIMVAREGTITAQRIAERLGVSQRSVQRLLADLEESGYLVKHKVGRRNRYEVVLDRPMRLKGLRSLPIGDVLGAFLKTKHAGVSAPDAGAAAAETPGASPPAS